MKPWMKKALIVLIAAAVLAGGFFGIRAIRRNTAPVKAYPVQFFADYGWNNNTTYGFITSGSSEVYRKDGAIVSSVYVQVGDTVKPGDKLFSYDTESLNLEVNRAANELQIERLRLMKYKEDLARYKTYKPYEPVIPYVPEGLIGETDQEMISSDEQAVEGKGTEDEPFVFYCVPGTKVHLNYLAEIIDNENVLLPSFWSGYEKEKEAYAKYLEELEEYDRLYAEYLKLLEVYEKAVKEHEENPDTEVPEKPTEPVKPEEVNDPSDDPVAGENAKYASFVIWNQNGYADMAKVFQWTVKGPDCDKGAVESLFSTVKPPFPWTVGDRAGMDASGLVKDFDKEFRFAEGMILRTDPLPAEEEIPESRSYTQEQINELIRGANRDIHSQEIAILQAEVSYNRAKNALTDGVITTNCSGTVKTVEDYDSLNSGEVFMQIQSDSGYVVQGSVSEFDRETVTVGTEVMVLSYMTGMQYIATVRYVADSPSSSNYFSSSENPNSSSYMFEAVIDAEAEVSPDDWVEISFFGNEGSDAFYIPTAFVRKENGQSYVMKYEGGKLKRQIVKTGKTLYGSEIQILEGLTLEDSIAFPYGKKVKEGAPCEVSEDMSELYG
ncbi:MAG: biotin/lipoyl-binding protein [Erysipelotrichales bacterium]|nr:biotin/lipoyl-binding protein [Erysipelotrichales bacterium]